MKRAKLILFGIGISAILSGLFSFRSKRHGICFCRIGSPGVCNITYLNTSFTITTTGDTYCTFEHGEQCLQKVITFVQP